MSYIGNEPTVSATRTITEITATAGQTVFVANGGYTVGYIDVFVNGAQLQTSDFTATNGSSISLISPATTGDDIRLVAWGTFTTSSSYTQAQADALLATKLNTSTNVAFKNRIINGDMRINQRNESNSVSVATSRSAGYNIDRWSVWLANWAGGAAATQQRSTDVPTGSGFVNSLLTTVTTGSTSPEPTSGRYLINQIIEGFNVADLMWGTASAKSITLAFWVKSSVTGNYGFSLTNSAGNRAYVVTYTIVSANTWEYKTINIPGDTSGTWTTDNTAGITLNYDLGVVGPTTNTLGVWLAGDFRGVTSSIKLINTTGATFRITGVQLEVGSSATPFDTRAYGTELALCQRYYYSHARGNNATVGNCFYYNNSMLICSLFFPTTMRAAPTLIASSGTNYYTNYRQDSGDEFNSFTFNEPGINGVNIRNSAEASGTSGVSGLIVSTNAAASVAFEAEL